MAKRHHSFGYDPLECPSCKHKMVFLELYYNHKRVSLKELYGKAMSKFRSLEDNYHWKNKRKMPKHLPNHTDLPYCLIAEKT